MAVLDWLPAVGVLPTVVVWGVFLSRGRAARVDAPAGTQLRHISVKDGYHPAEVHVAASRPVRLVFRREETAPCSERVVFPDLGISADLPAFQDIAVDLPASEPGAHAFCCQMDMLQGRLIVEAHSSASARGLTRGGASMNIPLGAAADGASYRAAEPTRASLGRPFASSRQRGSRWRWAAIDRARWLLATRPDRPRQREGDL